ncbi:DnaB-like helicase N-terminal domain-containing protein [Schlesneria sp. DSM 10557]|uniref:DnaB-like helicase N-terminal domain-containing protein n=1 Tax=Schlesneria sp. DSM 10557 TaxID=3044399 RepID=UPI0035A096C2
MNEIDDIPPHSIEAEKAVVACCLLDSTVLPDLVDTIQPRHFYNDQLRLLYQTILKIADRGNAVDELTLADELNSQGMFEQVGGAAFLIEIMEALPHAGHFRTYAKTVRELAATRDVRNAAKQVLRQLRYSSADPSEMWGRVIDTVTTASESLAVSANPFAVTDVTTFCDENSELSPYVLTGIVRLGETMNFVSASKLGKSWLVLCLALCVACGLKWLGRFWACKGRVLIIDNELSKPVLASRIRRVAEAMNLSPEDYAGQVDIKSLRGELMNLDELSRCLSRIPKGTYSLIVLDAFYRFANPGMDENSNSDQTAMYNRLDQIASSLGAAIVCVIHSSKGNQSAKAITDVGSGAGAMSRAADVHAVLRPHEVEGAAVFEAAIRSSPPVDKFVMKFEYPLWTIDESLDPNDLKREGPRRATKNNDEANEAKRLKEIEQQIKILEVYETYRDGDTKSQIAGLSGLSGAAYGPFHTSFMRQAFIKPCEVQKSRKQPYPGFKITDAGLEALRSLRQTLESIRLSESDMSHSDKSSSFRRTVCLSVDRTVDPSLIADAFGETTF